MQDWLKVSFYKDRFLAELAGSGASVLRSERLKTLPPHLLLDVADIKDPRRRAALGAKMNYCTGSYQIPQLEIKGAPTIDGKKLFEDDPEAHYRSEVPAVQMHRYCERLAVPPQNRERLDKFWNLDEILNSRVR